MDPRVIASYVRLIKLGIKNRSNIPAVIQEVPEIAAALDEYDSLPQET